MINGCLQNLRDLHESRLLHDTDPPSYSVAVTMQKFFPAKLQWFVR